MKLLLDENLSYKLVKLLCDEYPDSTHVMLSNMEGAPDEQIWAYARDEDYIIVTQDAAFMNTVCCMVALRSWYGLGVVTNRKHSC